MIHFLWLIVYLAAFIIGSIGALTAYMNLDAHDRMMANLLSH